MKKQIIPILSVVIAVLCAFLSGLFFGRKISNPPVQVSAVISDGPSVETASRSTEASKPPEIIYPIDINTASHYEITSLPGIGDVLAQRIIDFRTESGPFSSPEELMNVYGISQKRYDAIKEYITIGG